MDTTPQTNTPQSFQQGEVVMYDNVDTLSNTSCSSPGICALSPNKFCVNQSELSMSQPSVAEQKFTAEASEPVLVTVFAQLPTSSDRIVIAAHNFNQFRAKIWAERKVHVEDAFLYVKLDEESDPIRVSVRGEGWRFVKNYFEVELALRDKCTPVAMSAETMSHMCWKVCARHKAPLKWTHVIIGDVLAGVGLSCSLSYRQVRTNIIQELVWRDLCFIKALGGKDCCLLADSTPVDENHELTAYLVSWVNQATVLTMYPIHVTIESGKSSAILFAALKRQFEYYQLLNKYVLEEGTIESEQAFDIDCIASTFTDRGAPIMGLGSRIAEDTHRRLLRMYELQHRTHIVDTCVAKVLAPGLIRPMRGPTYQAIIVAHQFICNNDPFSQWMHHPRSACYQVGHAGHVQPFFVIRCRRVGIALPYLRVPTSSTSSLGSVTHVLGHVSLRSARNGQVFPAPWVVRR